jgi:hypothetical protein
MNCLKYGKWILLAGLSISCGVECCSAQVARYQPRTSTVSPYLNLGRFNGGGLPNYYALVRPQIQQRQFNAQASGLVRQQGAEISALQKQVDLGLPSPELTTGTGSWFMTPGVEHGFLNTSRFYPEPLGRGRVR